MYKISIIRNNEDITSLLQEFLEMRPAGYHLLYRGESKTNYKLVPSIARFQPRNGDLILSEKQCFDDFMKYITKGNIENFKLESYNPEMFYMSTGRHLGLSCRLIDWTARLETALYFASKENGNECGQLHILKQKGQLSDDTAKISPFDVKELTIVKEGFYSKDDISIRNFPMGELRRFRQNGFFTVSPTNCLQTPINEMNVKDIEFEKILISADAKREIMQNLASDYKNYVYDFECNEETEVKRINAKYFHVE